MQPETKQCQNCQAEFTILPDDAMFYGKVNVPFPTFCPECRLIRKMCWRNERIWYRRICDATGKNILSTLDPKKPYKVYEQEYWRSDAWDPLSYGREYDFSRNFFEQFSNLVKDFPHPNLVQKTLVNSEYSNNVLNLKNCYMAFSTDGAEDCAYISGLIRRLKDCLDMYHSSDDEFCYDCADCEKSSRLFFSEDCGSCVDSFFLYDCTNCISCFGCVGLRNKQYHIFNQKYSKEEYTEHLKQFQTGSYQSVLAIKEEFEKLKLAVPRKYALILNSQNVTGDDILNSRNCYHCFNAKDNVENCRYSFRINQNIKDGSDGYIMWNGAEMFYESMSSSGQNIKFSGFIWGGFDVEYSYNCFECNNIFGCTGLRSKSYCILNKQYSPEEYSELVPKIKAHMNEMKFNGTRGRVYGYGEFFPMEISLFYYNETPAQEYFPKTKDEVMALELQWQEPEEKRYSITKTTGELPDDIKDVTDDILSDVIECAHQGKCDDQCSTAFRIIPMELAFYKRFNLPLPRLCFGCRHMRRVHQKNPLHLWHRDCLCDLPHHGHEGRCPNEFETPYAPERLEKVFCERCYQQEIV